jgi:hypothetical protein
MRDPRRALLADEHLDSGEPAERGFLPNARRLVSRQLDLLEAAGLTPEEARRMYASYQLLTLGRLTVDEAKRTRLSRGPSHVRDPKIDAYLAELQGEAPFEDAVRVLLGEIQRTIDGPAGGSTER